MIKVAGGYYIDADSKCYWFGKLIKRPDKKTGEIKQLVDGEGYYSTFAGAVQGVAKKLRLDAMAKAEGDLTDALEVIKKCDDKILKFCKQYDDLAVTGGAKK